MKLSSQTLLHDIQKSAKKLQFYQLQIESRKDIQNINKLTNDHIDQDKQQFSWQIYHSDIQQQNKQHSHSATMQYRTFHENKQFTQPINPYQQYKYVINQQLNSQIQQQEVQSEGKIQQQAKDVQFQVHQRQVQIIYNKCISNGVYLKTQLKQLQKLINFSLLLEQEKQLKDKIAELNSVLRKIRLRSISKKILVKQKNTQTNNKNSQQINNLAELINLEKRKLNKLSTKLVLLNNYISASKNPRISKSLFHTIQTEYLSEKNIEDKKPIFKRKRSSESRFVLGLKHNLYTQPQINEAYFSIKNQFQSIEPDKNNVNLLKQYAEILNQTILQTKQYTNKKVGMLIMQKLSLKKQIESVKLSILKVQNEGRKYKSIANSLRRVSFSQKGQRIRNMSNKNQQIKSKNKRLKHFQGQYSSEKLLSNSKISSSSLLKKKRNQKNQNSGSLKQTSFVGEQNRLNTEIPSNIKETSTKQYSISKNEKLRQAKPLNEDIRKQYFNI